MIRAAEGTPREFLTPIPACALTVIHLPAISTRTKKYSFQKRLPRGDRKHNRKRDHAGVGHEKDNPMAKKKLRSRVTQEDRRQKQNSAGASSRSTRNDVPSTPANKVASGKQKRSSFAR
jgi:hypothetical protein